MKTQKTYTALHLAIIRFYLDGYKTIDAIDLVKDLKRYQEFKGHKFNVKNWDMIECLQNSH